jgi:hypothetical protein
MTKKYCIKLLSILLLAGLCFASPPTVSSTSIDRLLLCNLQGHPGETIEAKITLSGTESEEREGYWDTYYKRVEGDDDRMDITSWITVEPDHYIIKRGESKVFTVKAKVPSNAEQGLWGATSAEAGKAGHSEERRTYIVFKDTITGGNVYSGLLIPVSVEVLGSTSPLVLLLKIIKANRIIALILVIVILLALLLRRAKLRKTD